MLLQVDLWRLTCHIHFTRNPTSSVNNLPFSDAALSLVLPAHASTYPACMSADHVPTCKSDGCDLHVSTYPPCRCAESAIASETSLSCTAAEAAVACSGESCSSTQAWLLWPPKNERCTCLIMIPCLPWQPALAATAPYHELMTASSNAEPVDPRICLSRSAAFVILGMHCMYNTTWRSWHGHVSACKRNCSKSIKL